MSECDEVAEAILPEFMPWFRAHEDNQTMDAARIFVRQRMPDETYTIVDNVTWSLLRQAKGKA